MLPDSLNEGEIEEAMESYQIVPVCDEVFKLKRIKGDDGS